MQITVSPPYDEKSLFTWDGMSGVNFDAVVYGCIPVVMSMHAWTEDEMKLHEI